MTPLPSPQTALAVLNLAICAAIAWSCICRLTMMSAHTTRARFRFGYSLILVAAASSGASPILWGEFPGHGQVSMSIAMLCVVGVGYGHWRRGLPDYARRSHA